MIPKYRAWDKVDKVIREVTAIDWSLDLVEFMHGAIERSFENVILMQSTGLKDKNGVEIFEGDVVKRERSSKPHDEILEIGFDSGSFYSTYIPDRCRTSIFDYTDFGNQVEVIGNIYENPELLKMN